MAAAGLSVSFKGDVKHIIKDLDKVQRQVVPLATAAALNKVVNKARTQVVKKVSAAKQIRPQRLIKERTYIKKATARKQTAILNTLTAGVLVEKMNWRATKAGVKAGQHAFPHGFKATIAGNQRPMQRKGSQRLPIQKINIPIAADVDRIARAEQRNGGREFTKQFNHELQFRLRRKGLL